VELEQVIVILERAMVGFVGALQHRDSKTTVTSRVPARRVPGFAAQHRAGRVIVAATATATWGIKRMRSCWFGSSTGTRRWRSSSTLVNKMEPSLEHRNPNVALLSNQSSFLLL
jgi:hypothetical protein